MVRHFDTDRSCSGNRGDDPDEEEAIITETAKVVNTLNSLCIEMDSRYDLLKMEQVRNIKEYNEKFIKRQLNPNNGHKYLPYIVVVGTR